MQYKYKRLDTVYPRKYDKGSNFQSEQYGKGLVVDCKPTKDPVSKRKYWNYFVEFQEEDGQKHVEEFSCEANEGIVMFPRMGPEFSLLHQFPLAS